jgi:hypothetical protein
MDLRFNICDSRLKRRARQFELRSGSPFRSYQKPTIRIHNPSRRGIALVDVIVGGVLLGVGLAAEPGTRSAAWRGRG